MEKAERRAVSAAYKERKVAAGIYAVRCGGRVFVGQSPNLASVENRLRFTLAHGTHPNRALQAAWGASGGAALEIEIVETLADEADAYLRGRALTERQAHWLAALKAERL